MDCIAAHFRAWNDGRLQSYLFEISAEILLKVPPPLQAMKKLRIVTLGISRGRSLTRPLSDARRFRSTRWYLVPEATRTTLGFGICSSFHFLSRRAKP
jgi:hypothetical protein